jgi:hypothetical protein
MELRVLIIQACNEITEDMCCRVINSVMSRVEEAARCNGGHIEHLIHRRKIFLSFCMLVSSIVIEIKIFINRSNTGSVRAPPSI